MSSARERTQRAGQERKSGFLSSLLGSSIEALKAKEQQAATDAESTYQARLVCPHSVLSCFLSAFLTSLHLQKASLDLDAALKAKDECLTHVVNDLQRLETQRMTSIKLLFSTYVQHQK